MKKLLLGVLGVGLLVGSYWFFRPTETKKTATEATSESETAPTEDSWLDDQLAQMSLAEKVGQLFFVRVPETNQVADVSTYHLGGYVMFGRDFEGQEATALKQTIASYQEAAKIPLLIGADEEGGTVTRISRQPQLVETPFLSPQALYQAGGWSAIKEDALQKADILNSYGIKTGLYPIADVATDPAAFIYDRTIGMDAAGTSTYVTTVVEALQEKHSGSTLKHFPGYGDNRDSHIEIVTDTRSLTDVQAGYAPFKAGIEAGADSILVAHNIIQALDDTVPASISPAVHRVIREELGFDGVVMTDDMDMAGLADFISQEEAGLKALQAGNDLVMSSSYQKQIPYVIAAIERGDWHEEALNQSVKRVLRWKHSLGII